MDITPRKEMKLHFIILVKHVYCTWHVYCTMDVLHSLYKVLQCHQHGYNKLKYIIIILVFFNIKVHYPQEVSPSHYNNGCAYSQLRGEHGNVMRYNFLS
jgi:hypothetical protein